MYSHQPGLQFTSSSSDIDKFLALTLASGIASFATLQAACTDFDTSRTDEKAVIDLFKHLAAKKVLTDWQINKLHAGKYKGFFIDDYCMLMQIGKGSTTSTYLAKDWGTGKQVALVVKPPTISPWVDGRPDYLARDLTPNELETIELLGR